MKKCLLFMAIWILGFSGSIPLVEPVATHFYIRTLKPGVWAAIHNDESGHAIGNAGIVDLGDCTLVFDSFMNLDAAEALKSIALQLTHHPVKYLINSHHHNDHIRGNQLFVDATVISTYLNRETIRKTEPEELRWEIQNAPKILQEYKRQYAVVGKEEKKEVKLWLNYFEGMVMNSHKVHIRLPEQVFNDSMEIHGSKRSVILKEFRGGHSMSDVVMVLPQDSIAFTGDLLFTDRHPYLADGAPDKLKTVLETLLEKDVNRYVPGHGEPTGKAGVLKMIQYITDVHQMVRQAKASGMADSTIMSLPVPASYSTWPFKRFYQANLNHFNKY